uniref:Uncharacterized protein n=1 Tax=Oryza rufipogon TaxID=4529 RepID=A0A0E0QHT6_ORYRU
MQELVVLCHPRVDPLAKSTQGGSSAKSKRQADINQEGLNLLGLEGFSTPPPRNNGQGAHSLVYQIKTLAPKASQMDFLFQAH